jgi:hypothetical protein
MTNLNASVKSRGVVLFAFNTDTVDYKLIAERASKLITHSLNLPVTVITEMSGTQTNTRLGYAHGTQWFNGDRYRAYELSPYDETLLLDSDYLVLDDALLKILDTTNDYNIMTDNQNFVQTMTGNMGNMSLNFVWATAVAFKKTPKSKMLFDLVGRVQNNYGYYCKLYNIRSSNFRNDYAFAIADNIINGYTASTGIPWTMLTVDKTVNALEIKNNKIIIREEEVAHVISKQNIHIMDKAYLQSDAYERFIDTVCKN